MGKINNELPLLEVVLPGKKSCDISKYEQVCDAKKLGPPSFDADAP
jgi:hypothetical protein